MSFVSSVDYANKRIYLGSDSFTLPEFDVLNVYREVRELRRLNEDHRKFRPIIFGGGNIKKREGSFTPKYVLLVEDVFLVPFNTSHSLNVIREVFSEDEREGINCFDRSPLSGSVTVDIFYNPPQVEVVVINTGGSALTNAESSHLFSLGTPQQNADTLLGTTI